MSALIDRSPRPVLHAAVNALGAWYRVNRYAAPMRRTLAEWKTLEAQDPAMLEQLQLERLRRILRIAGTTPFYAERFRRVRFNPEAVTSLKHLEALPVLRRSELLANFDAMLVPGTKQRTKDRKSSGTTGQPVRYRQPVSLAFHQSYAMLYQFYGWHGVAPLSRRATLAGRYMGARPQGVILRNLPENQLLLGVHALTRDNVSRYLDALARFRPEVLQAHPSAMLMLKKLADEQGLSAPAIATVAFTGETLLETDRRELMAWCGGRMFGTYGSGELHIAAGECSELNGYHLHPMVGIAELVPSVLGNEIVGTSLLNDVMPLIRYQTGDIAERIETAACPCGCTWPRLMGLQGRTDDVLFTADGRAVPPVTLRTGMAAHFSNLPPFTIVQHKQPGTFSVRIYADTAREVPDTAGVQSHLEKVLGPGAKIAVRIHPRAELLTARAKHKIVVKE